MLVYIKTIDGHFGGPHEVLGYDGRESVRLTNTVTSIDELYWRTEEGEYLPVKRKQLQRFRGECG